MGWPCNMLSDLREPARDCESPMNPLFISPPKNQQNEEILLNIDSVDSFHVNILIRQYHIYIYIYTFIN